MRNAAAIRSRARVVADVQKASDLPGVLLQAVVIPGIRTHEGQLIEAVAFPWFDIIAMMLKDPEVIYKLHWRKWEEIIAGAYTRQGFQVTLTPRSGDRGIDVIAESKGVGCIRYVDQVKAYTPGHLVSPRDVREMLGVLLAEKSASKGIITTTSDFAPGILKDKELSALMPTRLELKNRTVLLEWLASLAEKPDPIS